MSILLHIPHSSVCIPHSIRPSILLTDDELERELFAVTDRYTDELFPSDYPRVVAQVSRLVCDVERFRDDKDEVMSKVGMGAVYTSTHQFGTLRHVNASEREQIMSTYYDPHHKDLTQKAEKSLHSSGRCLIIDAHSFPSKPLPTEIDQNPIRPDICIGTDDYHTPPFLAAWLREQFEHLGYSVGVNHPFAGSMVPTSFYQNDPRISSIMIEINRDLYMDSSSTKIRGFNLVQNHLRSILSTLNDTWF